MGKYRSRNHDKELDKLDHLKVENKHLKKQIAHMRKELSKLENRYNGLEDLVEQQYDEDNTPKIAKEAKKDWTCHSCGIGQLKLFIINKVGIPHYLRKCNSCPHKTKLKRYTPEVKE